MRKKKRVKKLIALFGGKDKKNNGEDKKKETHCLKILKKKCCNISKESRNNSTSANLRGQVGFLGNNTSVGVWEEKRGVYSSKVCPAWGDLDGGGVGWLMAACDGMGLHQVKNLGNLSKSTVFKVNIKRII